MHLNSLLTKFMLSYTRILSFKVHYNTILPSIPESPKWSLCSMFFLLIFIRAEIVAYSIPFKNKRHLNL